jgi:hypothetical protein
MRPIEQEYYGHLVNPRQLGWLLHIRTADRSGVVFVEIEK